MPRSGSTLLCNLLSQSCLAGYPNSFYRPQSMADFVAYWGIPAQTLETFDQSYLATSLTRGTAGTGCFGMRIMWNNVSGLVKRLGTLFPDAHSDVSRLNAAFGPLKYIHLSRTDKVAEAVSLAMATQTGLWHRNADGSELERTAPPQDPVYDYAMIAAEYATVVDGDVAWRSWFASNQITSFNLSYEDLAADPQGCLADVLGYIDVDQTPAKKIMPGTAKLTNAINLDWARRFRTEAGIAPAPNAT